MSKSAVVILAAGIGSRMSEITSNTSKCIVDLDGITPLEHTIKSFVANGVSNIIIVIGHYHDKVKKSVVNSMKRCGINAELEFVLNDKYNHHGCEYSLACASSHFDKYDTVYITEGDLLLSEEYVSKIVNSSKSNAVLLRDSEFIDKTRSVVAIDESFAEDNSRRVTKFVYDPDHVDVFKKFDSSAVIRGESIQLWKFSGQLLNELTNELKDYANFANAASSPVNHSGLFSINKVIKNNPLSGVKVDGYEWLNLNTVEDVEHAKTLPWLNR